MRRVTLLGALALLGACNPEIPEPDPTWRHYADRLGDPIDGLDAETLAAFERGDEVLRRDFTDADGLGPTFNADSCHSCHGVPIPGGASPHYRDFFLVKGRRWDGALVDQGSNGQSPVRNLYALDGGHVIAPAETGELLRAGRRNAPPMFGIGLFEFVSDAHILSREDPDDLDGDGISGRANYEQGRVGRFGVKSQAANLESFNRGAMFNQMGLTSNPLFEVLPDEPVMSETAWLDVDLDPADALAPFLTQQAFAQVSAPGEPTTDNDGVPDPEMSDQDQRDLLIFSVYAAPPKPLPRTKETEKGARLFADLGCTGCHVQSLESRIGPIPAYTDLLVHDLGEDNSDGLQIAYAGPTEFRTAPLWGVGLTAPYMHDGGAETYADAIALHGGEAAASRDRWNDLDADEQALVTGFLNSLGPYATERPGLLGDRDSLPEIDHQPGIDDVGVPGGPREALTGADRQLWLEGQALFDRNLRPGEGLGSGFNADSCRACHQDPVLGGAGGVDTNVIRVAENRDGVPTALDHPVLPRVVVPGMDPMRFADIPLIVETRQPPTILGVGLLDEISDEAILALEDPTDLDGDGISGRARVLSDGTVGRFGWKAQIGTLDDFAADALLNELGATLPEEFSTFTGTDDDEVADPELPASEAEAISFYMRSLTPGRGDPDVEASLAARGEAVFSSVGCDGCHVPELDGVPIYSDLLLHDVADPFAPLVDQEGDAARPREFRTPPLWGLAFTGPYLHDGSAFTLEAAISGHHGEAEAARDAAEALSDEDLAALVAFLRSI